jgi:hypothetical protein
VNRRLRRIPSSQRPAGPSSVDVACQNRFRQWTDRDHDAVARDLDATGTTDPVVRA